MFLIRLLTSAIPLLAINSTAVAQSPNVSIREIPWTAHRKPDSLGVRKTKPRNTKLSVTVFVRDSIGDSGLTRNCMLARGVASGMFATAGVHINWRTGQPKAYELGRPILIDITSNTPEEFHRGVLAYALVFEGDYIRVFYDRIKNPDGPHATTMLLAHVMVHEIAHILEGVDGHSEHGIMKSSWTPDDVVQLVYQPLTFDPEDVQLIRKGLAWRDTAARIAPFDEFLHRSAPIE